MKHNLQFIAAFLVAVLLVSGCQNPNNSNNSNNSNNNGKKEPTTPREKLEADTKLVKDAIYTIPSSSIATQETKISLVEIRVYSLMKYGSSATVTFEAPNYNVTITNGTESETLTITVTETGNIDTLFAMKDIPAGRNVKLGGGDWENENPARTVPTVPAFKMSEALVTKKLFKEVMGFNPSHFIGDAPAGENKELRPVDSVNWYTAAEFCNKLTEIVMGKEHCVYTITDAERIVREKPTTGFATGIRKAKVQIDKTKKGFRLPDLDEWEWAAGCGDAFKYAGSNNLDEVAWNSKIANDITHEVKKLKPNKFGLYDMTGNLWEWCGNLEDNSTEADDTKQTVQKGACALCPIGPYKDIYAIQAIQTDFYLNVAREKSGFRVACNAD